MFPHTNAIRTAILVSQIRCERTTKTKDEKEMKSKSIFLVVVVVFAVCIVSTSFGTPYSFQGLGDLAGGTFGSRADSVSADGSVVVGPCFTGGAEA